LPFAKPRKDADIMIKTIKPTDMYIVVTRSIFLNITIYNTSDVQIPIIKPMNPKTIAYTVFLRKFDKFIISFVYGI
jgi:hypothetical protein